MALIDAFLTQTAAIKPFIRAASGELIYGDEERRPCRIEQGANLEASTYSVADGQIDQIVANARMYCRGDAIPNRSIVICDGREYTVIKCSVLRGFHAGHLEVYLV